MSWLIMGTGRTKPQGGEANVLMIMAVFLTLTTLALGVLSIYYVTQYNRAQLTVNEQKSAAAAAAKIEQKQLDEAEFAQRLKEPYRTYTAPSVYGDLKISFPKNWSLFVEEGSGGDVQLSLTAHPDMIRPEEEFSNGFGLRATMTSTLYTEAIAEFDDAIAEGEVVASAVTVKGVSGTRYDGTVRENRQGTLVMLPIRDKTFAIWTESKDYASDFTKILAKLVVSR
ncbi:hypothetical protein HY346_02385 [Candidatus Microgenomates bacterium]|nr:hypothetical protein [Candidatus Microgenomates bacterium]